MPDPVRQGRCLIEQALPHIARHDGAGLAAMLAERWTEAELITQLASGDADCVKTAVTCLSVAGTMAANEPLARVLYHDDPVAVRIAEHAMWTVWFRAGSKDAGLRLRRAVKLMDDAQPRAAREILTALTEAEPGFAESYNQRAICHYLEERFSESIADCDRTLLHNVHHFGAMAGRGHCYAQLKQYDDALTAYRAALRIHPHLDGIRQSIRCLRRLATDGQSESVA